MVAKLYEAACKGTHASQGGPDDDGSDENFVYDASMPTVNYGTGSFTIANVGNPATIDASLVFDSTGGGRPVSHTNDDDTSSCSSGSLSVLIMDAPVAGDFFLI